MAKKPLKIVVGDNLRRLRREKGITQERLAELLDRDPSSIAHFEQGNRLMGVELLLKIADSFAVSTDELLRPPNETPHYKTIISMLSGQSDEALAHLEPIIRAWLNQYGDPKPQ